MKVLVNAPLMNLNTSQNEEFNFFTKKNIEKLESKFKVLWNCMDRHFTREELIERIEDVDAVFTHWFSPRLDAGVIAAAPKLKIMAHLCGTVKPYISEELYNKGIKVIGANDLYFSESVAEGVLAYALVSLRRIDAKLRLMDREKKNGWYRIRDCRGLINKTVGIVSFGAIAEHFARILQPFRCKIKVYSRSVSNEKLNQFNMEAAALDEIFSTCDVISIHTAYNEQTHHMIDKKLLRLIKKDALLINTARGGIIDEEVLAEELKKGSFYAVLDVFEKEPLPSESIFYDLENVIVMPHSGGPTHDRYPYITSDLIDEVYDYLTNGTPLKSEISREKAFSMSF